MFFLSSVAFLNHSQLATVFADKGRTSIVVARFDFDGCDDMIEGKGLARLIESGFTFPEIFNESSRKDWVDFYIHLKNRLEVSIFSMITDQTIGLLNEGMTISPVYGTEFSFFKTRIKSRRLTGDLGSKDVTFYEFVFKPKVRPEVFEGFSSTFF